MCNSLKVDQKGRLKIPNALLNKLTALGTELYVTSENGISVRIYPMRVWNEVEGHLERLCLHNNQKLLARVKYFGGAVRLDRQGRVIIPTRSAKARANEGRCGRAGLRQLSGSLEPCPLNEPFEGRFNRGTE